MNQSRRLRHVKRVDEILSILEEARPSTETTGLSYEEYLKLPWGEKERILEEHRKVSWGLEDACNILGCQLPEFQRALRNEINKAAYHE